MKRLLFVFILMLSPVPTLAPYQSQTATDMTKVMPNGRFWSKLTDNGRRESFLFGYAEGVTAAAATAASAEPTNYPLHTTLLDLLPPLNRTSTEVVQGMNHFYQDTPENTPVPLNGALDYVRQKASGATQSELDELAARWRRAAASPEKKP